jgi:uncharacterized repeat protein (TIGR03803 family)
MPATPRRSSRRFLSLFPIALALVQSPAWSAPAVSTVLSLSGSRTLGGVVLGPDGDLYGASSITIGGQAGGLVFKVEADGGSVSTLYQLGENDGVSPQTGLLLGSDGILYGTTHFGVTATGGGPGTVFSIRPDGTGYTTLHEFVRGDDDNQDASPINTDGAFPDAALIEGSDGFLYGVTRGGGANGTGTVFKIARDGTGFATLHVFGEITSPATENITKNADGAYPAASLLESNGYFYGTANRGGANGRGTVFRLRFDGSGFAVLHVFTNIVAPSGSTVAVNEDGATPVAALLDGEDGLLYGVASVGGAHGVGTVFSMTPDGTVFTTLHDFETNNGSQPSATPTLGTDGKLYGTTSAGGTNSTGTATSFGTIWSMARDGTAFTKVYSFDGTAGASPNSAMLQLSSSAFVGTTSTAGRCGEGTVFRLSLTGETITGQTSCGQDNNNNDSGGGAIDPAWLMLLGLLGCWRVARRRTLAEISS